MIHRIEAAVEYVLRNDTGDELLYGRAGSAMFRLTELHRDLTPVGTSMPSNFCVRTSPETRWVLNSQLSPSRLSMQYLHQDDAQRHPTVHHSTGGGEGGATLVQHTGLPAYLQSSYKSIAFLAQTSRPRICKP